MGMPCWRAISAWRFIVSICSWRLTAGLAALRAALEEAPRRWESALRRAAGELGLRALFRAAEEGAV